MNVATVLKTIEDLASLMVGKIPNSERVQMYVTIRMLVQDLLDSIDPDKPGAGNTIAKLTEVKIDARAMAGLDDIYGYPDLAKIEYLKTALDALRGEYCFNIR